MNSDIIENERVNNNPQSEDLYLSIREYVVEAQRQVYTAVNA